MTVFDLPAVRRLVRHALEEDVGRGDLTTRLTVAPETAARASIVAKQNGVLAGLPLLPVIFAELGTREVVVDTRVAEGARFHAGDLVAVLDGNARVLLTGERLALNFLQQLSGIATLTRRYVDAVEGTSVRVVDTRKTHPGLRLLEKYAVRAGGGANHRLGLDDGVLIKDNHIAAAGGIAAAVARAREGAPHTVRVEVECATLPQVDEALVAGADLLLLDNMPAASVAEVVRRVAGRARLEASGGVTLETVRALAETGVDLISVGELTHSAPAVDLSLRLELAAPGAAE